MSRTNTLLVAADMLEKAAAYIEEIESTKVAEATAALEKEASKVAQQVSEVIGEPVSEALVEKLSTAPADVRDLISKMAGEDLVDPMGGPEDGTKTASVVQEMGSAEASLMSWLQTP